MPEQRKKVRVRTHRRKTKKRVWKYRWVRARGGGVAATAEKPAKGAKPAG
jgi:hypothetical protein